LFKTTHHDPAHEALSILHPNLLLIYNLIPIKLSCFFYNYIGNQKTRNQVFLNFISDLVRDININIWRRHRQSNLQWESSLNITPKRKRNYRKYYRQQNSSAIPTNTDESSTHDANNSHKRRRKRRRHPESDNQSTSSDDVNHHITMRPYYKRHSTITQSQHIRWTSSNFLHRILGIS
jgi:hypothetical protein